MKTYNKTLHETNMQNIEYVTNGVLYKYLLRDKEVVFLFVFFIYLFIYFIYLFIYFVSGLFQNGFLMFYERHLDFYLSYVIFLFVDYVTHTNFMCTSIIH